MDLKEYIALDLGIKQTGVARGSNLAKIAQPLETVKTDELIARLQTIIKGNNVHAVVVGLPRNLSGDDTNQTKWVRQWVTQAKSQLKVPIFWQDEALTSIMATGNQKIGKVNEHSLAAAMILQDFLDSEAEQKVLA